MEILVSNLNEHLMNGYKLIDIRDGYSISYGIIPSAICIPEQQLLENIDTLRTYIGVIICSTNGLHNEEIISKLRELDVNGYNLVGGYNEWLLYTTQQEEKEDIEHQKQKEIEKGLQKKWKQRLFTSFARAIKTYNLVEEGDRIAVCISGGKDSMLMAKLFQELKNHRKKNFELVFLGMDPGYSEANRKLIECNADIIGVDITIFESNIFDSVFNIEKNPCYLCARMRRGHLYSKAKELGCNKIALGHHFDDVIETNLMSMLYGGQIQSMLPKLNSTNFEGMELIRPMYLIREHDIKAWRDYYGLHFLQCACKFTESCAVTESEEQSSSKRLEIKNLIKQLKKNNPTVESNIFRSMENVMLDTVLGYKSNGIRHSFLDK